MRVRFVNRKDIGLNHELIWGSIGTSLGLVGLFVPFESLHIVCAFKAITGLPCLTCGMTRSWIHLRQLDLAGAAAFNPLMTAFYIFAGLYCAYAIWAIALRTRRVRIELTRPWEATMLRVVVVFLVVGNWSYLLAVHR